MIMRGLRKSRKKDKKITQEKKDCIERPMFS